MAAAHDIITNFTVPMAGTLTTTNNTYKTIGQYLDARDKGYVTNMGFEAHLAKAWPYVDNLNLNVSKYSPNYNSQSSLNVPNYAQSSSYQSELSRIQNANRTSTQQTGSLTGKKVATREDIDFIASSDKAKTAIKNVLKELAGSGMSEDGIKRAAAHLSSLSDADRADAMSGFYQLLNIASTEANGTDAVGTLQFYINGLMGFNESAVSQNSDTATKALEDLDFAIEALKQSGNTANSIEVLMPMLLQLSGAVTPMNEEISLENMPEATQGYVNFGVSGQYNGFTMEQFTAAINQVEQQAMQTVNLGAGYQAYNNGQVPVATGAENTPVNPNPAQAPDLGQVPNVAPQADANGIIPVDLASTLPGYAPKNLAAPIVNANGEMVGQAAPQTATPVADMVGTPTAKTQQNTNVPVGESVTVTSYSSSGNPAAVAQVGGNGEALAANGVVAASAVGNRISDNSSELATLGITGAGTQNTVVAADGTGLGKALVQNGAKTVDEQVMAKLLESAKNTPVGKTSQVEMTLNPDRLGKIFLKMVNDNGSLSITVAAQNPSTEKLLQQKAGQLLSGLQENGVVVKDIQVVTGGEQSTQAGMDFYAGQNGSYSRNQQSAQAQAQAQAQAASRSGVYGSDSSDAADDAKATSGGHSLWQTI